jgi:hypothetical protein
MGHMAIVDQKWSALPVQYAMGIRRRLPRRCSLREALLALRAVNQNPFERPVVDLGF